MNPEPMPCPKCGSRRTDVIGKSQTPPAVFIRCGVCGYTTMIEPPKPRP